MIKIRKNEYLTTDCGAYDFTTSYDLSYHEVGLPLLTGSVGIIFRRSHAETRPETSKNTFVIKSQPVCVRNSFTKFLGQKSSFVFPNTHTSCKILKKSNFSSRAFRTKQNLKQDAR